MPNNVDICLLTFIDSCDKIVLQTRTYVQIIEELTPDILHSFVDRIYIGETEVYEGQKFQDIKIVYNLVGAIDLAQYVM